MYTYSTVIKIRSLQGGTPAKVMHLSRADALSAARVTLKDHQEYLVLSDNFVWEESDTLRVVGGEETLFVHSQSFQKIYFRQILRRLQARVSLQFIREARQRIMQMYRRAFPLRSLLRHQRSFLASL